MRSNRYRYRPRYSSVRTTTTQRWRIDRIALALLALLGVGLLGYHLLQSPAKPTTSDSLNVRADTAKSVTAAPTVKSPKATTVRPVSNACASNTLSQELIVSVSKRHLWACAATTVKYDSAVVTGMENLPADLTPVGTYKIYSKQTGLYLNGSDSTGSWHDYVYYWMPWLSNQYGIYGFHDATWRKDSDFGNISPYSSNASHGCVELPLTTAKWVYGWAPIGTTVKVIS